jgi:hypothetical protein
VVGSLGGECGQEDVEDERAHQAVKHHGSATELIEQRRTVDGSDEGEDGVNLFLLC